MKFDTKEDLYKYIIEEVFTTPYSKYEEVDDKFILNGQFVDFINGIAVKGVKRNKVKDDAVEEWYNNVKTKFNRIYNGYSVKNLSIEARKVVKEVLESDINIERLNLAIEKYYKETQYPKTLSNFFLTGEYKNIDDILKTNTNGKII